MQYTNSAKCDVKKASLVQLQSCLNAFSLKNLNTSFAINPHVTQAFQILPLERFLSVLLLMQICLERLSSDQNASGRHWIDPQPIRATKHVT